ncbi:hypothetical protein D3C83_280200 [compost metagenome]
MRFALYSGKIFLRNVCSLLSKITARCVGFSPCFVSRSSLCSMLEKPETAPVGMPSDLRESGGSA